MFKNNMDAVEDIPEEAVQAMISEDWHTAYRIISDMANRGNMNAEHFMGWFYEQGIEVEQSDKKAFEWWQKSAPKGIPESQSGIAQLYESGRGTDKNYINAYVWYSKAVMSGDKESQILLANLSTKMSKQQLSEARSILNEKT